jgi:hypothetical protein
MTWENSFPMFKMTTMLTTFVGASLTLLKETTFGNLFKRIPVREFLEIKFCFGHAGVGIGQTYRKYLQLVKTMGLTPMS